MNAPVSAESDATWPDDAVEVARVLDAWGIKGWLRIQPHAGDPQALLAARRWFLQPPADRPRPAGAAPLPPVLNITLVKEHGDGLVASAREVADRNGAEALRGARIFVPRASFPKTADDEFYWVDLIGLEVVNRDGAALGRVEELFDTGAHSVLRVVQAVPDADGRDRSVERLIPFVSAYVDSVDLPGRRIVADWGLDY